MSKERLYIVTYDIADKRRWRRMFRIMQGYGEWLQLSVFQCRLTKRHRAELETQLRETVKDGQDHMLMIDAGLAAKVNPVVESIGRHFSQVQRQATVI